MATIVPPMMVRMKSDRIFYSAMGLAVAATVVWGFAATFYFARWMTAPPTTPDMSPLLYVHGAVFTCWVVLMVVQPMLIASRHIRLHRRLGYAGAAIAAAMVVLGHVAAIAAMHGGFRLMGDPLVFYAIPFLAINTFAVIVALAILNRNRPETHKRLILLANAPLVEAAIARIPLGPIQAGAPFSFTFLPLLIVVAGIVYDWRTRGRVHKVWIWGGLGLVAIQALRFPLMGSAAWRDFAATMAALWT